MLLGLVDAQYNFVVADIGAYGRHSDASIFSNSMLGKMLKNRSLHLPREQELRGTTNPAMPYVFVADEAFPLLPNMMRPYPGDDLSEARRIFNYRLSGARRIVENAFGILAARFRCFRRPLLLQPCDAAAIIKGAVVLHNFLRHEVGVQYVGLQNTQDEVTAQSNNKQMLSLPRIGRPYSAKATEIRNCFKDYFMSEAGAVPWQQNVVHRTR